MDCPESLQGGDLHSCCVFPCADDDGPHAELTTFQCREAYVYKIPPASTIGHRAELWDVDHWLQAHVSTPHDPTSHDVSANPPCLPTKLMCSASMTMHQCLDRFGCPGVSAVTPMRAEAAGGVGGSGDVRRRLLGAAV